MTASDIKRTHKHLNNTLLYGLVVFLVGVMITFIDIHRYMTDVIGFVVILFGVIMMLAATNKKLKFKRFLKITR